MLLIQNGNVYDPASGTEGKRDILTANGKIVLIRPGISREDILRFVSEPENDVNGAQVRTIDASGLAVMPGFIDTHSHFRDPGFTEKEDINTGAAAAAPLLAGHYDGEHKAADRLSGNPLRCACPRCENADSRLILCQCDKGNAGRGTHRF